MNRKYVGILILLLILVVTVSSCGNQTNAPSGGPPDPGPEETPAPVEVEKITFTTGELTVVVPKDWTVAGANETMDGYVQEDAKLDTIYLVKNMETEMDVFSKPGIQINYYDENVVMVGACKDFYENTADLDPIELENYTWEGYTGESMGYPLAILFANKENGGEDQFQVAVWMEMSSGDKITLQDEDVLEILASIKPAK